MTKFARQFSLIFFAALIFLKPAAAMDTEAWEADLDFLVETLVSVHPNPFHRTSEDDFYKSVDQLKADLDTLEDHQVVLRFMQIITQLNDGHTGLDPYGDAAAFNKWFPLRFERFEEGIYIISAAREYQDLIGAKVLKLGTMEALELYDQAMATVNGDNQMTRLYYAGYLLPQAKALMAFGAIEQADEIILEIEKNGVQNPVSVKSITMDFNLNWFWPGPAAPGENSVGAHDNIGESLALTYKNSKTLYGVQLDEDKGVAFVHFTFFMNGKDFSHLPAPAPTLAKFYDQIFEVVDNNNIEKLVIDIRNNGGGNNQLIPAFIKAIKARPAINQRGKLFVITGRRTYSAAMNFVSMMAAETEAIFVGEAPAGSPQHYGDATGYRLPNSRMYFGVSTLAWSTNVEPWDLRVRFQPDIVITPKASYYFAGADEVFETILDFESATPILDQLKTVYNQEGLDAAMAAFEAYRQENPDNLWVHYGYSLLDFGAFVESRDGNFMLVYESTTKRYPEFAFAWFTYGRALYYARKYGEAEKALATAARLRPGNNLITRFYAAAQKKPKGN